MSNHEAIAQLRARIAELQVEIDRAVWLACPGPHLPRQHRDGRPPWCKVCRYTVDFERVEV